MRYLLVFTLLLSLAFATAGASTKRGPAVAGTFYPADSVQLAEVVNKHLAEVTDLPEIDGQIIALIVPHAGLVYSGGIAAHSYKLLENTNINKVFLCGPSHKFGFNGLSVYGPHISWTMPFGTVHCDKKLGFKIFHYHDDILFIPEPHAQEHSLEVQLPYLQTVLDDFRIVPIAMGNQNARTVKLLEDALKSIDFDSSMVMISATDWQHFKPASEGWSLDSVGISCIESLDPLRLQMSLERGKTEMCGGGPTVAVMKAAIAYGADRVKILKYGDSGDISGDKSNVVGYLAAVLYKSSDSDKSTRKNKTEKSSKEDDLPDKFELTEDDKSELLKIARKSINSYLSTGRIPEFDVAENLQVSGAGFVTLKINGQLRGCIGYTTSAEPLFKTVSECAVKAAVSDRRFSPVQIEEMDHIDIEISVLTPMQKIETLDEIVVGRDGLMIFKGSNRGLLLPQVPVEYNWDRTTFLEHTCQKANLPPNAYLWDEAIIYKFQAVIFGELEQKQ